MKQYPVGVEKDWRTKGGSQNKGGQGRNKKNGEGKTLLWGRRKTWGGENKGKTRTRVAQARGRLRV